MSSFSDTFTKDSEKEEVQNYDDAASYYFGLTVLLTVIVPWTWSWVRYLIWGMSGTVWFPAKRDGCDMVYCRNGVMEENLVRIEKGERRERKKNANWYIFKLSILGLLWLAWFQCLYQVSMTESGSVATFDPFEILGISSSESDSPSKIKKAYRTQSLLHHPDKNPNDPHAQAKFYRVHKAYKVLTDDEARKNFAKYGNPDGPGTTKVGIGLPRFLLDKKNHLIILMLFFIFMFVVMPCVFIMEYMKQRDFSSNGVRVETLQFMGHYISENTREKNVPELLACSSESRGIEESSPMQESITLLKDNVKEFTDIKKQFDNTQNQLPIIVRNNLLILCHMQRKRGILSAALQDDLDDLLKITDRVMLTMIEIACVRDWLLTAQSLINFRRCMIQGMEIRSNSLMQIPHFTPEIITKYCTGSSVLKPIKDIKSYISNSMNNGSLNATNSDDNSTSNNNNSTTIRRGTNEMTDQQKLDVEDFVRFFPRISVNCTALVEGEKSICKDDVATIRVEILREHLRGREMSKQDKDLNIVGSSNNNTLNNDLSKTSQNLRQQAQGYVHAPFYPLLKEEEFYIFLLENNKPITHIRSHLKAKNERRIVEKIQFQVGRVGLHDLTIQVLSDSYLGIDVTTNVTFMAKKLSDITVTSTTDITTSASAVQNNSIADERKVVIHHEDQLLDEHPTWFQQMFTELQGGEDDSDDEEEDGGLNEGNNNNNDSQKAKAQAKAQAGNSKGMGKKGQNSSIKGGAKIEKSEGGGGGVGKNNKKDDSDSDSSSSSSSDSDSDSDSDGSEAGQKSGSDDTKTSTQQEDLTKKKGKGKGGGRGKKKN